jgi:hypothetical protein
MEVSGKLHGTATLTQGKESYGTYLRGGWLGHKGEETNSCSCRVWSSDFSVIHPVAKLLYHMSCPTSYPAIITEYCLHKFVATACSVSCAFKRYQCQAMNYTNTDSSSLLVLQR